MLQYWRVILLIIMVLASLLAIGLKIFPYGREGVEIAYISSDSPANDVLEQGWVITQLNGESIKSVNDWNSKKLSGNLTLVVNGKKYNFYDNQSIGINVMNIERTNLDFGLDLKGGTRIILKPIGNITEELVDQTISVLETRANLFGLQEIKLFQIRGIEGEYFIQVEAAGVGNEIVDELLSKQGKFDAKIIKPVEFTDNQTQMLLGESSFVVEILDNNTLEINNTIVKINDTFTLKDIEFEYVNITDNSIIFLAKIFDGDDIELVYTDPQRSGVIPQGNVFQFFFQVLLSIDGATKFSEVTVGIPKYLDINSGEEYLDSSLLLYIDGNIVSNLRIGAGLAGQIVQSPQVMGTELSMEEALQEKLRLQTILKSGALPVQLETLSVDILSPTLGAGFFDAALLAVIIAAAVVLIIVFIRYRKIKVSVPLVLIGISEAIIILGIAATNDAAIWGTVLFVNLVLIFTAWMKKHEIDIYAWIGAVLVPLIGMMSWTIDLPAIAGIIAVIGTGVDHQIIIADEAIKGKKKVYGIKEQLKMAFFIILGAASTTIFAMMPLLFVGVGLVRGFAITTIVGVLVGILITRPAYARIVEKVA